MRTNQPMLEEAEFPRNQSVEEFNISEENLQKMTAVVHLKLT